ncbi:unnamed protein product, partial [Rotaria sp. Silwood2]
MADFAPQTQVLEMVEKEYLKIVSNINDSITWDDAEKILKKVLSSSTVHERNNILSDSDINCDEKILFEDLIQHIETYLNDKKDRPNVILE